MKINITKIKKTTGKTFQFRFTEMLEPQTVKGEQIVFAKPVEVEVSLANTGGQILRVVGTIKVTAKRICSRCLSDFEQDLNIDMEENYIPSSEVSQEQYTELENEELTVVKGEELDLREKVLENILLAIPMKTVCQPDCKGICQSCGINLNEGKCNCRQDNVDPRLQILGKLFQKNEGQS